MEIGKTSIEIAHEAQKERRDKFQMQAALKLKGWTFDSSHRYKDGSWQVKYTAGDNFELVCNAPTIEQATEMILNGAHDFSLMSPDGKAAEITRGDLIQFSDSDEWVKVIIVEPDGYLVRRKDAPMTTLVEQREIKGLRKA